MAADGSLRFDTSLDPEGFERGSEKLKASIANMVSSTERLGKRISGSLQDTLPKVQAFGEAIANAGDDLVPKEFGKYIEHTRTQVAGIADEMTRVQQKAAASGLETQSSLSSFTDSMEQIQSKIAILESRLKEIGSVKVETSSYAELAEKLGTLDAKMQELTERQTALNDTMDSAEGLNDSAEYQRLQTQMDETAVRIANVTAEMNMLAESGEAYTPGSQTEEYQQLAAALGILQDGYGRMGEAATIAGAKQEDEARKQAESEQAAERAAQASARKKAATIAFAAALGATVVAATRAVQGFAQLASSLGRLSFQAVTAGAHAAATAMRAVWSAVKNASSAAAGFASGFAGAAQRVVAFGGRIASAFARAASAIGRGAAALLGFGKNAGSTGGIAENLVKKLDGLKRMLVTRIKRTFISAIFKNLTSAIEAVSSKSSEFNAAMTSMQSAASGLSTNLASLFGGIIATIAPIVTQIINYISTLISWLNALFAVLSGKSTILTAKKNTDAYGKSAGGAAKKAKELKKQVLGFDEITNLTEQDDSGGGGGGGGGPELVETPIDSLLPDDIKAYFEKLKAAITSENWEEVGSLIADALNAGIGKINEAILALHDRAVAWAGIAARILNGIVGKFDFPLLGETIGNGLNLIIDACNTFLTTFNSLELGRGIAASLNSLFDTVNFENLGKLLANHLNFYILLFQGFVHDMDWTGAGKRFGVAANAMFDQIKWYDLAVAVSTGFDGLIQAADGFIKQLEEGKEERQQRLSASVRDMILGINWTDAIRVFSNGVQFLIDWATMLFANFPWDEWSAAITEGLNTLIQNPDSSGSQWSTINTNLGNGIQGIIDAFGNLVDPKEGIDFETLGNNIGTGIAQIAAQIDFSKAISNVVFGMLGLGIAFSTGFLALKGTIKAKAEEISKGINSLVEDPRAGEAWQTITKNIGDGVQAVIDGFADLTSPEKGIKFDEIGTEIGKGLTTIATKINFTTLSMALFHGFQGVASFVIAGVAEITNIFPTKAAEIVNGINTLITENSFEKITGYVTTGINNIIDAFAELVGLGPSGEKGIDFEGISDTIAKNINTLISDTNFEKAVEAVLVGMGKIAASFLSGLAQIRWSALAERLAQGINDFIHNPQIDWEKIGADLGTSLINAIEGITTFLTQVKWEDIGRSIGAALANIKWLEIGQKFLDLLKAGILGAFNLGVGFLSGVFKPLENAIMAALPEVEVTFEEVKSRFFENGVKISDSFAEALTTAGLDNIFAAMKLMGAGVSEETMNMLDLTNLDANLQAYMQQTGLSLEQIAKLMASDVGDSIGSTIPEAINNALQQGKTTVQQTAKEVTEAADTSANQVEAGKNAEATAEKVTSGLTEKMEAGEPEVTASSEGLVEATKSPFESLPEDQKAQAEAMLEAINLAITAGTPAATATMETAADAVVKAAADKMSRGAGETIANTFISGIIDKILSLQDSMYNQMTNVGASIDSGIAHGIYTYTTIITTAARNAAIAAYNAAMAALQAGSPSKLFADVGKYMMQGWAIGEEKNQGAVIETVANTSKALEEEARETTFDVGMNTVVSGLDVAIDRLTEIASIFTSIGEMIAGIGDLPIPSIATGSVIPYRTRISDSIGFDDGGISSQERLTATSMERGVYQAIRDALRDTDESRPINLYLDGKQLAGAIARINRNTARATGV